MRTEYNIRGEEQGDIANVFTMKEARELIKDLKRQDKEENIQDKYFIEVEQWENGRKRRKWKWIMKVEKQLEITWTMN